MVLLFISYKVNKICIRINSILLISDSRLKLKFIADPSLVAAETNTIVGGVASYKVNKICIRINSILLISDSRLKLKFIADPSLVAAETNTI